ncbi:jouberin-like [Tigriopus californicus]|uniref:jouberin-like n=1 Tax=Tigriopus californicus TaxID=6832 RepID=UPI0027DA0266|nr:jouberin-like [Tigriopus californicus]
MPKDHSQKAKKAKPSKPSMVALDERIFGIFIHSADTLNLNLHVSHPVVCVILIDLETGKQVDKPENAKHVTSFYDEENVKEILPMMTQPCSFKTSKSLVPKWDELILFNVDFSHLESLRSHLGVFFVIRDFVTMSLANNQAKYKSGWIDVAWAFLVPFPEGYPPNVGKKLRLQLFQGGSTRGSEPLSHTLWTWWKKRRHLKYPSTLFVTVQSMKPPEANLESDPETMEGQKEASKTREGVLNVPAWSRHRGQTCEIPKAKEVSIEAPDDSEVSCMRFSRSGRALAVAFTRVNGSSTIHVFHVPSWQFIKIIGSHPGTIYELDWDLDDTEIVSASADRTAGVWSIHKGTRKLLEHPSFVYCARFHPNSPNVVISGCYDKVIRVWIRNQDSKFLLAEELISHNSFISALELDPDGQNLFSGDDEGFIRIWEVYGAQNIESDNRISIRMKKEIQLPEFRGYRIQSLQMHPGGRRLLVHSSSFTSSLLMIDTKLSSVMQSFGFESGRRDKSDCSVSPCGSFVFASSLNTGVIVFDTDTANEKHRYEMDDIKPKSITFHPFDNFLIVYGQIGEARSILVFKA